MSGNGNGYEVQDRRPPHYEGGQSNVNGPSPGPAPAAQASFHYRPEHAVRVDGPSVFHVLVRRVNMSSPAFLSRTSEVVRFSQSQYAIPNSRNIKLRTAAYYRDWEENDSCGIGDSEEATLRRNTDFVAFQREAGQTPLPGADYAQISSTYREECWILTAVGPSREKGAVEETPSRPVQKAPRCNTSFP